MFKGFSAIKGFKPPKMKGLSGLNFSAKPQSTATLKNIGNQQGNGTVKSALGTIGK
jgi:hypothetical protein